MNIKTLSAVLSLAMACLPGVTFAEGYEFTYLTTSIEAIPKSELEQTSDGRWLRIVRGRTVNGKPTRATVGQLAEAGEGWVNSVSTQTQRLLIKGDNRLLSSLTTSDIPDAINIRLPEKKVNRTLLLNHRTQKYRLMDAPEGGVSIEAFNPTAYQQRATKIREDSAKTAAAESGYTLDITPSTASPSQISTIRLAKGKQMEVWEYSKFVKVGPYEYPQNDSYTQYDAQGRLRSGTAYTDIQGRKLSDEEFDAAAAKLLSIQGNSGLEKIYPELKGLSQNSQ